MNAPTGGAPAVATATAPTAPVEATAAATTATPHSTLVKMTGLAGRGFTVVRDSFVQVRRDGKAVGSSLGLLVTLRRPRALLAYLLVLMVAQPIGKREKPLEAQVWARALSPDPPAPEWADAAMTPIWNALEGRPHRLITRERQDRLVKITPRKENGKGPYVRPRPDQQPSDTGELYFALPDAFWLDGWHYRLSSPGIAVLLILLAGTQTRDETWLSPERADEWYGISTRTMRNGLEDLRKAGLLRARDEWVPAELSAIGTTKKVWYSLNAPFGTDDRRLLQETAREAAKQREAAAQRKARRRRREPITAAAEPPVADAT